MNNFKGRYRIILDGNIVSESDNMITDGGKITIKQFLVGNISTWANAIAVGAMDTSVSAADTKLGFEYARESISSKSLDKDGNIIIRAEFPTGQQGIIREVGLYPFISTTSTGKYQDDIITDFTETTWSSGSIDTTNMSIGASNLLLGSPYSTSISGLSIDISGYSSTDKIELLVYNTNSTAKTIEVTFSDGSLDHVITLPTTSTGTGIKSVSAEIGQLNISTITGITISSNGAVSLDCLKFLNTDESGYVMNLVSRSLPTPITKNIGQSLDIEYILAVL